MLGKCDFEHKISHVGFRCTLQKLFPSKVSRKVNVIRCWWHDVVELSVSWRKPSNKDDDDVQLLLNLFHCHWSLDRRLVGFPIHSLINNPPHPHLHCANDFCRVLWHLLQRYISYHHSLLIILQRWDEFLVHFIKTRIDRDMRGALLTRRMTFVMLSYMYGPKYRRLWYAGHHKICCLNTFCWFYIQIVCINVQIITIIIEVVNLCINQFQDKLC